MTSGEGDEGKSKEEERERGRSSVLTSICNVFDIIFPILNLGCCTSISYLPCVTCVSCDGATPSKACRFL